MTSLQLKKLQLKISSGHTIKWPIGELPLVEFLLKMKPTDFRCEAQTTGKGSILVPLTVLPETTR